MVGKLLHSKTKTVTFAAFLLLSFSLLSRAFGLLRNNLLGNIFPNADVDVYLAAFRIPDLLYGILITGGIVSAFLPILSASKDKKKLVRNVFSVFILCLTVLSFLLFLLAPYLAKLTVPGFDLEQRAMTVTLMRIMFLSPIILGASAILSGVLQYFRLFLSYALAPVFYNLGIIFGILVLAPKFGLKGVAMGVVIGGLFHFLIQLPAFKKAGYSLKPFINLKSSGLKRIFSLMIPRSIGSIAHHLNLIVTTAIASGLSVGSIMVFGFSSDLYWAPIGLIGISFSVASFPALSKSFAEKDKKEFLQYFSSVFSQILFLSIPLSVLLFLYRAQVVRLLYGTRLVGEGFFTWQVTKLTAASLGIFCVSIFAACFVAFLSRVFYSLCDTKTPVKISLVSMAFNIVAAFSFVYILSRDNVFHNIVSSVLKVSGGVEVLGLSMAVSLSALLHFTLLYIFLKRKLRDIRFPKKSLIKIIVSSLLMAVVAFFSLRLFDFGTETVKGLLLQLFLSFSLSFLSFLFFSFLLKSKELKEMFLSLKKQFKR